jgi:uncharacterized protein YjbI with pentapeptide repeats
MDTNSNIPAEKRVVRVDFPNLKEKGFGWDGSFTREDWRKACLDNFLAGKEQFETWQDSWKSEIDQDLRFINFYTHGDEVSFEAKLIYDDGTEKIVGNEIPMLSPWSLDFVGSKLDFIYSREKIIFKHDVLFCGATFNSPVDFVNAEFEGVTSFNNATFVDYSIFSEVKFRRNAYFNHVNFRGNSFFSDALFKNSAYFSEAIFGENAYYNSAKFKEEANFCVSTFCSTVDFGNSSFKRGAYFCEATFVDHANFENATFQNVGHFEEARFLKHTPAFRGCQIDSTRLEFSDDSYFPKTETTEDAIKNISFLKRLADEHGQTDQALNFNAMELRAKRKQVEPKPAAWSFKVATWSYEKLSDYGRSFTRPLIAYLVLFLITLGIGYWCASQTVPATSKCEDDILQVLNTSFKWKCLDYSIKNKDDIELDGYRAAFEFAAYRGSGIIDFSDNDKQTAAVSQRVFGQPIEPGWARAWGILKAIASTALLFLAALGLRNKYRIK